MEGDGGIAKPFVTYILYFNSFRRMFVGSIRNTTQKMTIVSTNGLHSNATIEQLAALCQKDGHTFETRPSRQGNFDMISINGQVVARAFNNEVDAFIFKMERA